MIVTALVPRPARLQAANGMLAAFRISMVQRFLASRRARISSCLPSYISMGLTFFRASWGAWLYAFTASFRAASKAVVRHEIVSGFS